MISIMVGHFDYKHRCLVEKNVPIALILPSRWQDGAESLGMECTSCLCNDLVKSKFSAASLAVYDPFHWIANQLPCSH